MDSGCCSLRRARRCSNGRLYIAIRGREEERPGRDSRLAVYKLVRHTAGLLRHYKRGVPV